MDQKRKAIILLAIGIVILLVFLTADLTGVGQSPARFGYRQIIGSLVGVIVAAIGVYLYRGTGQ